MNPNGSSERLDRIEQALDLLINDHVQFREEHKGLLTAQVLLTGQVQKIGEQLGALTMRIDGLTQRLETLTLSVFNLTGNIERIAGLMEAHAKDPSAHKS